MATVAAPDTGLPRALRVALTAALVGSVLAPDANAQAHYYNLDAGRPIRVEDAVPTERYGVDVHFPAFRLERLDDGTYLYRAEPKLSAGVLPLTSLEIRAPISHLVAPGVGGRGTTALSGVGVAAMRGLNVETTWLPAMALAGEALVPVGGFSASRPSYAIQLLATKTTPILRTHLNASLGTYSIRLPRRFPGTGSCPPGSIRSPDGTCEEVVIPPHPPCALVPRDRAHSGPAVPQTAAARCGATLPAGNTMWHQSQRTYGLRWAVGVGADRTFPLHSMLVGADVYAERFVGLYPAVDWTAELGLRRQWSPRIVLDLGVARHFAGARPSSSATFGLTYSFAVRAPRMPRVVAAGEARDPSVTGPFEQAYLPARHNEVFRSRYRRAERLLNGFDYGHAILYETLVRQPSASDAGARLDGPVYDYIVRRVLRRPPHVPLEERAIGPRYATLVPELLAMFEWAHMLHRQLYDVMADERLTPSQREARAAEVLRYYRSRSDLALSAEPKSMTLMEGQPFSLAFRRVAPKLNGLIWSYHWLQIALYEALLVANDAAGRRVNLDASLARFWTMVDSAPAGLPTVMPMSPVIAPRFSEAYPEAAIIFDNLHALHDVAADILASPLVPPGEKRAAILKAAAEYRDTTTAVTSRDEWREHSAHMGVEQMGGRAPVAAAAGAAGVP